MPSSMPSRCSRVRNPFLGEDAHQVIFERKIEAGRSGIALAAGAAAKLVVDAPRFVTLGAEDVQSAGGDNFIVFFVGLQLVAVEDFGPLIGRDDVLIAGVIPDGALGFVDINLDFALARRAEAGQFPSSRTPAWP